MALKLTLSRKVLILVAVPLAFELALVICLRGLLYQVEQEKAGEIYARDVSARLNTILRLTLDMMVSTIMIEMTQIHGYTQLDARELPTLRFALGRETTELKALVRNHPEEAKVAELDALYGPIGQYLDNARTSFENGDNLSALKSCAKMKAAQKTVFRNIEGLIAEKQAEERERVLAQRKSKDLLYGLLIYGAALNVNLAILMAFLFNRSTTQRLDILVDNTVRLASSEPLHPPLEGDDELAQLDKTFNKMAKELAAARRKEQDVVDKAVDAEARLRILVESLPIGLAVIDKEGVIRFANSSLKRMFELSSSDLAGKNICTLFRKQEPAQSSDFQSSEQFVSMLIANAKADTWELAGVKSSSVIFPVEISVTDFANNALDQQLVIVTDVTAKREIERVRQEFMAMITHDLRAPLTSVQGFLGLLDANICGELNAKGRKKLEAAEGAMNHLLGLIRDLLDMERCRAGKLTLDKGSFSIVQLIDRAIDNIRLQADSLDIQINRNVVDCQVIADGDRIIQTVTNLLSNALKFSPKDSTITIETKPSENWLEIQITDQGRGIPPDYLDKIFDRFQQVKPSDAKVAGGSGLGLAICKAIVEQHGGEIGVHSSNGQGSTFWFRLPIMATTGSFPKEVKVL